MYHFFTLVFKVFAVPSVLADPRNIGEVVLAQDPGDPGFYYEGKIMHDFGEPDDLHTVRIHINFIILNGVGTLNKTGYISCIDLRQLCGL